MLAAIFTKRYLLLLTILVGYCLAVVGLATGVIPKFW